MREWEDAKTIKSLSKGRLPSYYDTYESYTGYIKRERLREDAQRFYLYYKAGYNVNFNW